METNVLCAKLGRGPRCGRVRRIQVTALVFLLAGGAPFTPHMGITLASPGANRCDLATATTVTPGSPGSPASFTLTGNNSSPGVCSPTVGPCAVDADCPGEACVGDCFAGFDRGYWEAFTLTADAIVTIHYCNTTPVRQGGDYNFVSAYCEGGTGACGDNIVADRAARADDCTFTVGEVCPEILCGAGNNNISLTFSALTGNVTYYLPILSGNVCERTDPFNQSSSQCETTADCPDGRSCVSERGPYDVRVVAEELPTAACCYLECSSTAQLCNFDNDCPGVETCDAKCDELNQIRCDEKQGYSLQPPQVFDSNIAVTCVPGLCDSGTCCTDQCLDARQNGGSPMEKADCDVLGGGYIGGARCKGGRCVGGADDTLSCNVNTDCASNDCSGTPDELAQASPCSLCQPYGASACHEPLIGFLGLPSDSARGSRAADDFIAGDTPITDVCWSGHYRNDVGNNGSDCGPGPGDAFTITYYTDAGGYPGATVLSQAVSPTRVESGLDGDFLTYQYLATLPTPVVLTIGTKYWIEIVNNTTLPPAACNWTWKPSNGGNNYSVLDMGNEYGPEDVYLGAGNSDVTFCLNASISPDDGGAVLGACCTCPSTCVDSQTRDQCPGVWHVGQSCSMVSCSPPSVNSCSSAQPLITTSISFHNTCTSRDGPTPIPSDSGPTTAVDRDVWYTYYPASSDNVTFSACDVSFDAVIAVYSNGTDTCTCPADNTTLILASDEDCLGLPYLGGGGTVTIPVTTGICYLVRIMGYNGTFEMGLGRLDVSQAGVPPEIIYVNAAATGQNNGLNWTNAFTKLQDALALSTAIGTEVWVAKGTYTPDQGTGITPGDRTATFRLKSGLALYGGFASGESRRDLRDPVNNETILSGDLNGDDGPGPFENYGENSLHIVNTSGLDSTCILDGFTITHGNADGAAGNGEGGGIHMGFDMGNPSSATIRSCIFNANFAGQGGAAFVFASSPSFSNCVFFENQANAGGGVRSRDGSSPSFTNCIFQGNTAIIGGQGDGVGGGINIFNDSNPTLVNCTFSGNTAATNGAGIWNGTNSNPALTNCSFSSNVATTAGGGVYNEISSNPTATNCVLWSNSDAGGIDESAQIHTASGTPTVNYSIVQGTWTGAGSNNLDGDPLFVNPGANDFRLQSGSPAIDAGDTTALPLDTLDLDGDGNTTERNSLDLGGNPRILDDPLTPDTGVPGSGVVDMGAYEYFSDCNGNGIQDPCELSCGSPDGPCDFPGCGIGADCNTNNIIDACDISECASDPACADCNLNGKPDLCDVPPSTGCPTGSCVSGCSADANEDCIPDECVQPTGTGTTTDFSDGTNWNLAGSYPDNTAGVPNLNVTLDHSLTLNVPVVINSLIVLEGVTLDITGGDLTITGSASQVAGPITPPPKLKFSGSILLSSSFNVSAPTSTMLVDPNGKLTKQPSAEVTDATVTAADVMITGASCDAAQTGGDVTLVDSMNLTVAGELILDGSRSVCESACPQTAGPITPPPKLRVSLNSTMDLLAAFSVAGDATTPGLVMIGAVDVVVDSTQPLSLGGDFKNRSVVPSLFDWTAGKLMLNGAAPQTFEVAGIDLGQTAEGFQTDADALSDSCPHTNYSMGTLEIAPGANVTFVNRFANTSATGCAEALYVHELIFQSGSIVTIDNCKIYYETLTNNGIKPTLVGCGELVSLQRPGDIVWDSDPQSPDRATRSLRFSVQAPQTATATPGHDAIKVTMVDLMHPDPRNLTQYPPPNFSTFDTGTHGTCAGATTSPNYNGHHCSADPDCLGPNNGINTDDGTCTLPGPACSGDGEAVNGNLNQGSCARWVGKPRTFYETQGPPLAGPYRASRLQCTPLYWDWITETSTGPVTVVGAEIVPSSEYRVQTYGASCKGVEAACTSLSAPVTMYTRRKGDLDSPYQAPSPAMLTQADVLDISQAVASVKHTGPAHYRGQMQPNLPELNADANVLDIVEAVDSVKRTPYSFSGPCVCPSAVICGGSCTGCTGMCVKTCVGGDNDGETCINNTHCPGVCSGGTNPGAVCPSGVPDGINCTGGVCVGGTNPGAACTSPGSQCLGGGSCSAQCSGLCGSTGTCHDKCGRCSP